VQLQQGTLIKQLRNAGVQIVVTPEQAQSLAALGPLLKISDTAQSSVDESQANTQEVKDAILKMNSQEEGAAQEPAPALEDVEDDWEDYDLPQSKALKARKAEAEKEAVGLYGKFVSLIDILPPLPKKGDFDVENIKKSLYFFS